MPFLQGVAGESMTGAPALVGQDRDLVHQVRVLRPTHGNAVGHLPDILGDQLGDERFQPRPQLLPQLPGVAARRPPRVGAATTSPGPGSAPGCRWRQDQVPVRQRHQPARRRERLHLLQVCGTPDHQLVPGSATIPRRRASTSAAAARTSAVRAALGLSRLVEAAAALASREGHRQLYYGVGVDNGCAIGFAKNFGFRSTGPAAHPGHETSGMETLARTRNRRHGPGESASRSSALRPPFGPARPFSSVKPSPRGARMAVTASATR